MFSNAKKIGPTTSTAYTALSKEYTVVPIASKARESEAVHPRMTKVVSPTSKEGCLSKKAKAPEKLSYKKSEDEVNASSRAEVKQWFAKLNQEAKERWNPEKTYLYVNPEELRKKVMDHQTKQLESLEESSTVGL